MDWQRELQSAVELLKARKLEQANGIFVKLENLQPLEPLVHYYIGVSAFLLGQREEALKSLLRSVELNPVFLEALIGLGLVYHSLGMENEALRLGEKILCEKYYREFGAPLDFVAPSTFTQKLFSRMVMMNRLRDASYSSYVDKYQVRNYVKEKVGKQYLVNLIWSGSSPDSIPYESLPTVTMFKANHSNSSNKILRPLYDRSEIKRVASFWLSNNYYWVAREFQYYDIKACLMIEEFLEDGYEFGPLDYRFFCFHGEPKLIQVDNNDHSINNFYDTNWNRIDLSYRGSFKSCEIQRPQNFDDMLNIARDLSSDFDFVRVDLYNCRGRILFGELTFTPVAGVIKFNPPIWDQRLGGFWNFTTPR